MYKFISKNYFEKEEEKNKGSGVKMDYRDYH